MNRGGRWGRGGEARPVRLRGPGHEVGVLGSSLAPPGQEAVLAAQLLAVSVPPAYQATGPG